jgi:D-alanyl-D-alanine carboxypeptidase
MERYRLELSRLSILPYYDKALEEQYLSYKMKHEQCIWVDVITYVNIGLHEEYYRNVKKVIEPYSLHVLVNKYNRLGEDFIPKDLEPIDEKFNPDRLFLRHDARLAFEEMCRGAEYGGLRLKAISTFRGFYYQWKIYLKDITWNQSIEEYSRVRDRVSARPGHSEHQTGLSVDINDLEQTFEATPEGRWLAANAHHYGFILRYPKGKEFVTGYDYEPWHYRYIGRELAESVNYSELTYDEFYARYLYEPNRTV